MDYAEIVLQKIQAAGEVRSEHIDELIKGHRPDRDRMIGLHERYKASVAGVPVLTRTFEDASKINNKLNNDFFSDIVDTKVGYFAGVPISCQVEDEAVMEEMRLFHKRNNLPDVDSETTKMAAICGQSSRLLYIDTEGEERVCNLPPWEVIYLHTSGIEEPIYAMRYYETERMRITGEWEAVLRVEWYDDTNVTYYVQRGQGELFVLDEQEETNPKEHLFDYTPIIGFSNNEELQGDCEKVLSLIDGYDRAISDVNSEVEQFRLAYLATFGITIDDETLERAKRTGAFSFPDNDCDMKFVTKMLEDKIIEHHLDRLEDNIMRFAKSVNMTDEHFSGTTSGISLRYKMLGLENKCITAERKMSTAILRMFKVLATAWKKRNVNLDWMEMEMQFTRNFPLNLLDEAESTTKLKGMVSEATRLSMLSFVEDVEAEMERMEEESAIDLDRFMPEEPEEEPEEPEGEEE